MPQLGRLNQLPLIQDAEQHWSVDAGSFGLLSLSPQDSERFDSNSESAQVFLYRDNERGVVATTKTPKALVGECASLKVTAVTPVGAFLDWGLDKELLVPFSEQATDLELDRTYVVYLNLDNEQRVVASAKLDRWLDKDEHQYEGGEQVDVLIASRTEMGFKAVVGHQFWGLLYHDQIYRRVRIGETVSAFISKVRDDGKIDLSLGAGTKAQVDDLGERILAKLHQEDGYLALTDKSSPQVIKAVFGVSKGAFKKSIGSLYKQGLITISKTGLVLNQE